MYIGQWHLSPLQRRNLGTSHTSPNYHQLPHHIFLNLIDCLINTLPVQRWFWFREMSEVAGSQIWIVGGWTTWVIWCFTKNSVLDKIYERAHCHDEAANHQLPINVAFWIIRIFSVEESSSLMQNLMQIRFSTHLVILNVMAIQPYSTHAHSKACTAPTD